MKYQFMDTHSSEFRLEKMSQILKVSRSGFYKWKNRKASMRKVSNEELLKKIKDVYNDNEGIYGSPRIAKELNATGIKCSKNRVARIMRENGIVSKTKKKFKVTTDSEHNHPVAENILDSVEKITTPNQAWISDITYIWTTVG